MTSTVMITYLEKVSSITVTGCAVGGRHLAVRIAPLLFLNPLACARATQVTSGASLLSHIGRPSITLQILNVIRSTFYDRNDILCAASAALASTALGSGAIAAIGRAPPGRSLSLLPSACSTSHFLKPFAALCAYDMYI